MYTAQMNLLSACLIVLAGAVSVSSQEHAWCTIVPPGSEFPGLSQLYECSSVPPYLFQFLWSPVQIKLRCSSSRVSKFINFVETDLKLEAIVIISSQFSVFRGDSKDLLKNNLAEGTTAYCGLENFFLDGRKCSFQMSPFWPTFVGIKDGQGKPILGVIYWYPF